MSKIKIKVTGKTNKLFIKELIRNKINIYDINTNKDYTNIIIDDYDLDRLDKIKTTSKYKIIERFGLNKIKHLIINNKINIILIILSILFIYTLSNIVFSIQVDHTNKELVNTIYKDLNEYGLKKYKFKPSYKTKELIKNKILNKEKDKIEWLEIEEHGTKYIIKVQERKINIENTCSNRNIVSNKNAVITKITASNGEIIKKINDYVTKDEILISGLIYNKDKIVDIKCANGIVYGETWYKVKINLPQYYIDKKISNKNNLGLNIILFNKNINLLNKNYKYYSTKYKIIKSNIIPINISISNYRKIIKIKKKYNINKIDNKSLLLAEKEILNKLPKDSKVLSKKVLKKGIKNSKIEVEVFLAVEENITSFQNLDNINLSDLQKEE